MTLLIMIFVGIAGIFVLIGFSKPKHKFRGVEITDFTFEIHYLEDYWYELEGERDWVVAARFEDRSECLAALYDMRKEAAENKNFKLDDAAPYKVIG